MSNHFKGKKVLLTGGSGCLGRALLSELLKQHALIWVTQHLSPIVHDKVIVIPQNNLLNVSLPAFDFVFHLAAQIDVSGKLPPSELEKNNVAFTAMLIQNITFKKFIFASTVSIYEPTAGLITETSKITPQNHYALTKWEAEKMVQQLPNYCILRFSSIFGEGMKTNTFLPRMIQQALVGKKMKIFGEGSRLQNYISVRQAVTYLISGALKSENYTGLAVAPKEHSNMEIAKIIAKHTQASLVMEGEDFSHSFKYDNKNTLKELALELEDNTISNDIKELIEWMRSTRY